MKGNKIQNKIIVQKYIYPYPLYRSLHKQREIKNILNILYVYIRVICITKGKKVKSSTARNLPLENLLPQNVGSIINYLQ